MIQLVDFPGLMISSFSIYAFSFFIKIPTSVGAIIMHLGGGVVFKYL